jgi:hypothetical protein
LLLTDVNNFRHHESVSVASLRLIRFLRNRTFTSAEYAQESKAVIFFISRP